MAVSEGAHGPGDSGGLVLVLNSGSSSVKFALLVPASGERALAGMAEKVGTPGAELRIRPYPDHVVTEQLPEGSHQAVISRILGHLPEAGVGTAENERLGPDRLT
jgi:acetate kinase